MICTDDLAEETMKIWDKVADVYVDIELAMSAVVVVFEMCSGELLLHTGTCRISAACK